MKLYLFVNISYMQKNRYKLFNEIKNVCKYYNKSCINSVMDCFFKAETLEVRIQGVKWILWHLEQ